MLDSENGYIQLAAVPRIQLAADRQTDRQTERQRQRQNQRERDSWRERETRLKLPCVTFLEQETHKPQSQTPQVLLAMLDSENGYIQLAAVPCIQLAADIQTGRDRDGGRNSEREGGRERERVGETD